jgi:hypothetical protein
MDAATLQLHRSLLRLVKGCVKSYEEWVEQQSEDSMVEGLREIKKKYSPPSLDSK